MKASILTEWHSRGGNHLMYSPFSCSWRGEINWWAADYYGLGRDLFGTELRSATMLEF